MTNSTKKFTNALNKKTEESPGKKGGMSVISPEMIGAMTGAAIGGLTGMMLANKKTREKLAAVKDRALHTAEEVLQNVEIKGREFSEDVKITADDAKGKIISRTRKSKS